MAWTTTVLASQNAQDAVLEVIDNHLPLRASWDVAVPAGNATSRNMRLDISSTNELTKQYLGMAYDSQYKYLCSWFNLNNAGSWEEQLSNYAGGIFISSLSNKFTYWSSNTLGDSFMIIDGGGKLVWGYLEPTQLFIGGDDTWGANGPNMYTGFCGYGSSGGSPVFGGPNGTSLTTSEVAVAGYYYDYNTGIGAQYDGIVYLGFPILLSGSTSSGSIGASMIAYYNTTEVLVQTGYGDSNITLFDGGLKKVTVDGTNWWLRSNGSLSRNALLIDVGPTEPVF